MLARTVTAATCEENDFARSPRFTTEECNERNRNEAKQAGMVGAKHDGVNNKFFYCNASVVLSIYTDLANTNFLCPRSHGIVLFHIQVECMFRL